MRRLLDFLRDLGQGGYFGGTNQHGHTSAADGGTLGAIIGTGQLKTATGSASVADLAVVTMNDFGFYPMYTSAGLTVEMHADPFGDHSNTVGVFRAVGGASVTRWRYITASDNPHWWVAFDNTGAIVGVWTSDDPPSTDFVGSPMTLTDALGVARVDITYRQIRAADLARLDLPIAAMAAADAKIAADKLKPSHRLYRALQAHADDPAPSPWLLENCKIVAGVLTPTKAIV